MPARLSGLCNYAVMHGGSKARCITQVVRTCTFNSKNRSELFVGVLSWALLALSALPCLKFGMKKKN